MKPATSLKLAIVAIIALLFAGFVLRAAMRLAATVTHSALALLLMIALVAWIMMGSRSSR